MSARISDLTKKILVKTMKDTEVEDNSMYPSEAIKLLFANLAPCGTSLVFLFLKWVP